MTEEFKPLTLEALGIDTTEGAEAVMPSGGEVFGAGEFIAPWTAWMAYFYMTEEDYVEYNQEEEGEEKAPAPDMRVKRGDWWSHWYKAGRYAEALDSFYKLTEHEEGSNFKPQHVFVMTAPTEQVINVEDTEQLKDGFGDTLIFDVRVLALRKGSSSFPMVNRHGFNFISFPCAVAAAADIFGLENAGYDITALLDTEAEATDERFISLCGDPEGGYDEGELYAKRTRLWKSLGEEDGRKSAVTGSKTAAGKPNRLATESEKLSRCFSIVQRPWTKPIWAKVTLVPDPRPGAVNPRNDRRLSIPAITEIYPSEVKAREVAEAEMAERGAETKVVDPYRAKLPENWKSSTPEELVRYTVPLDDLPPPTLKDKAFYDSLEQLAWWRETELYKAELERYKESGGG